MTEFLKYPKIYHKDSEECEGFFSDPEAIVVVEEKIDGGNFRFCIRDGKPVFGSHNRELVENDENNKFFNRALQYLQHNLGRCDLSQLSRYIFYGEMCVKHTINYDWEKIPPFLGFDIYDTETGKFIAWDSAKRIFYSLGIWFVPVLKECKISELGTPDESLIPQSHYWDGSAEGVVIKCYETQKFTKIVAQQFKEKNKEAFGLTKKQAKRLGDDDETFTGIYATNARIDKQIFKMMLDRPLEMKMMEELPSKVITDIWIENLGEILKSNYTLNLRNVRKLITKRCLVVLQQIITNNKLNEAK